MAILRIFQSTPPVRGATFIKTILDSAFYISIHAPRAGGDNVVIHFTATVEISIHAPRAGGDSI